MTSHPRSPRRWLRVLLPAVLVLVWLAGAGLGGPLFGKVEEVSSNDPAAYLPTSAEATAVQDAQADFSDADGIPAIVVLVGTEPLTEAELDQIGAAMAEVADLRSEEHTSELQSR